MANDNLTKARITKLKNQISGLGLNVPVLQEDLSLSEQEALLKEFWAANKTSGDSASSDLRRQADLRGIDYSPETDDELLAEEIKEHDRRMKQVSESRMEQRRESVSMDTMKEFAKEVASSVAKEVASANSKDGDRRVVSEREYDPNDLTESRTYFAPMVYYKLPMKRIGGQLVEPPFGKIEFKMLEGSSVRVGDQNQTRYISSYTTDSKREQAYIETHPKFGKSFFHSDSAARITSDEHKYAIKFGERMNMLRTYQAPDLYRMAGDLGIRIDLGMSLDTLRDTIASEQAKADIIAERAHRQTLIEQSDREILLRRATATQ